jgi:hypothetical protein
MSTRSLRRAVPDGRPARPRSDETDGLSMSRKALLAAVILGTLTLVSIQLVYWVVAGS